MNGPLKYFGGKHYMAKHIHALAAPHKWTKENPTGWLHRVIPFAGGLGEFWGWECEGVSEVINDIDGHLMNFYEVLRGEETFARFRRLCEATPFSESLWERAREYQSGADNVERAWLYFVLVRQSMAGMKKSFAPISRKRVRRGMNEQASAWTTAVDGLPEVHERLRRVVVFNRDALEVIAREDSPSTLFFIDCPYLHSTREAKNVYSYEMTDKQHEAMLTLLRACKGRVMLSGYPNALYDDMLAGWSVHDFSLPNNASAGKSKRVMTERIWANFS